MISKNIFFLRRWSLSLLLSFLLTLTTTAFAIELTPDEVKEVLEISKSISLAKFSLPDSKKLEYAMGVFKASKRFQIDSNLLIAIASQETSFREDLPEGKAGEFGIVQIRKIWIKNPKLRKYFKTAKLKDLNKPEKAFLYAAWILRDLKDHAPKSSIPFWSFYNAKGFQPRFRYFLAVNQKLSYLSKKISFTRDIANNIQVNGSIKQEHWIPDVRLIATHSQIPLESTGQKPNEPLKKQLSITTASLGEGITIEPNGWIAEALARLQTEPITQNYQAYNTATPTPINQLRKPKIIASSKSAMKLLQSIQD